MSDTACCDGFHTPQSHATGSVENSEVEILIETATILGFHANLTYCLSSTCESEPDQSCKEAEPIHKNKQKQNSTEIFKKHCRSVIYTNV